MSECPVRIVCIADSDSRARNADVFFEMRKQVLSAKSFQQVGRILRDKQMTQFYRMDTDVQQRAKAAFADSYIKKIKQTTGLAACMRQVRSDFMENPGWLENEFLVDGLIKAFGAEQANGALAPVRRNRAELEKEIMVKSDLAEIEMRVMAFIADEKTYGEYLKRIQGTRPEYQKFKKAEDDKKAEKERKERERKAEAQRLKKEVMDFWFGKLDTKVMAQAMVSADFGTMANSPALLGVSGKEFMFTVKQFSFDEIPHNSALIDWNGLALVPAFQDFTKAQAVNPPRWRFLRLDEARFVRDVTDDEYNKLKRLTNAKRKLDLRG